MAYDTINDADRIRSALSYIDAADRDVWLKMGMAIKSELGEHGFDTWDAWGQSADNYNATDSKTVWRSIRADGKVGIATLFFEAKQCGWQDDGRRHTLTPAEIAERQRAAAQRAAADAAEIERERAETAAKATAILKAATAVMGENPYLARKRASPTATLREIDVELVTTILGYTPKSSGEPLEGRLLVVPVKQGDALSTVELIDGKGRKTALAGRGSKAGGHWATRRPPDDADVLLVGEGVATVLSASEATRHVGIAALASGNLMAVASAMRDRYQGAELVLLADLVKSSGLPDPHAVEAARAVGGRLAIPDFGPQRDPGDKDMNDLFVRCGAEAVQKAVASASAPSAQQSEPDADAWANPARDELAATRARSQADISGLLRGIGQHQHAGGAEAASAITLKSITLDELHRARLTPRIVLDELLYADVRTRISGGGTGKTTLALFEAVTLALGRELWGRTPEGPRKTVIVTREDGREILVARLREIAYSMMLDAAELAQVTENVTVLDLTSEAFRLSRVIDDVVYPHTENIDALVAALQPWAPDWVIFDPLVSFGVGESRINDAEQGLIEAFRIIRNRLNCCVEGIHHSGKVNAQEKRLDQYAGRGGSALSDGCRMVCVMQPLDPQEWAQATGTALGPGETGLVMALPKLSYTKSQQPIFIKRAGYRFTQATVIKRTPEQSAAATTEQVLQFIRYEFDQGRRYSKADLENSLDKLQMVRAQLRSAITALKVTGRVVYHEVKGKAGSHYEPLMLATGAGEDLATPGDTLPENSASTSEGTAAEVPSPPIGKEDGGDTCHHPSPSFSRSRRESPATPGDTGGTLDDPAIFLGTPAEIEVEL